jgi:PIN domain nuclease of toxin-antitoxin system
VRVVADTHAFYWYYRQPQLLSGAALATLHTALVGGDGVVVSVATYMDLWYLVRKGSLPSVALSHVWSLARSCPIAGVNDDGRRFPSRPASL